MKNQNGFISGFSCGFTLVELMVTLIVLTILVGIAAPNLTELYDAMRSNANIRTIQQTIQYGRNAAISYGVRVTTCPIKDYQCDDNWQNGLTVFTDSGEKNIIDSNDKILIQTAPFNNRDTVIYNRTSVRFQPDGLAYGTNGTLRYCPSSKTSPYSKAVIINQAGRVRFSKDTNISCDS
ncbi:GspH/FimT family pseudopilin [Shewanella mesophila]|uniref:GspH/FimT family pseudopilin n=1 Tax=Shewanella mesophila TaxID=2864208 RepID=UPI001C65F430|nr:GspH/FimT family pseudopilin [Shewanella mesophila]QYJ85253.1 GspH/FimT family pseudopilin [Shewanella mesophila]